MAGGLIQTRPATQNGAQVRRHVALRATADKELVSDGELSITKVLLVP